MHVGGIVLYDLDTDPGTVGRIQACWFLSQLELGLGDTRSLDSGWSDKRRIWLDSREGAVWSGISRRSFVSRRT